MSNFSRRSLVASAAALPALAVPAAVMAIANPSSFDKAAFVRRAEQIVDLFNTRYIREGWRENFDKARAAEFLDDARRYEISAEDTEAEEK